MSQVVGVRFRQLGKVHYFDPAGITLEVNDHVVVETSRGLELGKVVISPKQVLVSDLSEPSKPIVRKAEPHDTEQAQEWQRKEKETLVKCRELVKKLNLAMKPLWAQYNLDGSHLTLFFSADERVDFRELARELGHTLRTRIELRQVGDRDEAKLIEGIGICGRPLCCTTFLTDFCPVTIKMAREQNVALNPMKISGLCGRLLCCLEYESHQYRELKEKLPKVGKEVITSLGKGKVIGSQPLKETVLVKLENEAIVEVTLKELTDVKPEAEKKPKLPKTKKR